MGYLHINNLYKDQEILLFKRCYALEKIHGTSAHIQFKEGKLRFFSGGEKHERFVKLFDEEKLLKVFNEHFQDDLILFGEAYGGSQQGMSETYGKELKFIVFDAKIGRCWLDVPKAETVTKLFDLEFVDYNEVDTSLESIDKERDRESTQAIRNGIGEGKMREGIVLRPLIELIKNNGSRIIVKHKRNEFMETKTPREVDPAKLELLVKAKEIADEWVTLMRLKHVLDKFEGEETIENTGKVIKAMQEDILREAEGEIVISPDATKLIGRSTALMYKNYLQKKIKEVI